MHKYKVSVVTTLDIILHNLVAPRKTLIYAFPRLHSGILHPACPPATIEVMTHELKCGDREAGN